MKKGIVCFVIFLVVLISENIFAKDIPVEYGLNDMGPYSSSWGNVAMCSNGNIIYMKRTNMGYFMSVSATESAILGKRIYSGWSASPYNYIVSQIFQIKKNEFVLKIQSQDNNREKNSVTVTTSYCHFFADEAELVKAIGNSQLDYALIGLEFVD